MIATNSALLRCILVRTSVVIMRGHDLATMLSKPLSSNASRGFDSPQLH